MAQVKGLVKFLQIKIASITSQKDQLHGLLDDYVQKMTSKAREVLEKEEQDENTLKELLSTLDTAWGYLVDITAQMEDFPSTSIAESTDQTSTQTSSFYSVSPTLPELPPATVPTKAHDSAESHEILRLQHRLEVLEIALTTCRNEVSQVNTDKNEFRDKLQELENHIQNVETSHSQGLDQKEERLICLEKLTQQTQSNMTKEIKDLEKSFKDNIRRTKLEFDNKMDSIDEEAQKTQEQNVTTIKEQASKLGKVEKKLKKMKGEEQERWSQIESIQIDLENLKEDQRDDQQLVKIQGLEKHMETLTSQCDRLQDQVRKIEPVIQMSQELAHKISILATDEQVQELVQTSTATSRSLEELTSKVEDTERFVGGCVAQRERDENRRREMEDRVAVLEAQRQKDLDHCTKELKETNSLYKAVCQLVDQRVTPLRRLQRMLNDYHKQVEKREEISTRLDDVVKKVEDIFTQLDKNERSALPARVGFTAYYPDSSPLPAGGSGNFITDFTNVLYNEGNHYKPSSGFTCPIDGLYMFSVTLRQWKDGMVAVKVMRLYGFILTEVCRTGTRLANTSSCGVGVVRLQAGDTVLVQMVNKTGTPELSPFSSFSGVLIA